MRSPVDFLIGQFTPYEWVNGSAPASRAELLQTLRPRWEQELCFCNSHIVVLPLYEPRLEGSVRRVVDAELEQLGWTGNPLSLASRLSRHRGMTSTEYCLRHIHEAHWVHTFWGAVNERYERCNNGTTLFDGHTPFDFWGVAEQFPDLAAERAAEIYSTRLMGGT